MSFFNKTMSATDHKRKAYDIYMESPNRATDKPRAGYSVVEYAKANQPKRPLSYDERQLEKKRKNRIRKNKRNARGRAQTQGAALGAVSNILGG
jgi:hypothetical protein